MGIDWIQRAESVDLSVYNVINGRRVAADRGQTVKKYSPRDGRLLYAFGSGDQQEVDAAVREARKAFSDGRWSRLPAQRRKEILHRLSDLIVEHRDELALLESLDVGKPIRNSLEVDLGGAVAALRFSAEAADKLSAKVYAVDDSSLSFELRRPVGVVGAIVGWNFPLYLAVQKIGPALAAGNCLVLKPSELTCLATSRVAELALEAGVPEGVLNVILGGRTMGAALAQHSDVDLLTFTGSSQTGKKLLIAAGQSNMKRLVLECGGKAPNIVFDDCPDPEAVAEAITSSAFSNQGQVCVASSRLLVQDGIRDQLLGAVIRRVSQLEPRDPLDERSRYGAVVSREHLNKIERCIEEGLREGADPLYRSDAQAPFEGGFYVSPTIVQSSDASHRVAREEIFGPVLTVIPFADETQAVHIANNTIYGLSAVIWSQDLSRALRLSQSVDAGWLTVNATAQPSGGPAEGVLPVGGHKQSGIGVEGGIDGVESYTRSTAVQWFGSRLDSARFSPG